MDVKSSDSKIYIEPKTPAISRKEESYKKTKLVMKKYRLFEKGIKRQCWFPM